MKRKAELCSLNFGASIQTVVNWFNRKNLFVSLLVCVSFTGIAGFFISRSVSANSELFSVGLTVMQTETPAPDQPESITTERPEIQWMRGGHTISQAIDHAWDGDTMATMSGSEVKLWRTSDNTLLRTIPKTSSAGRNRVSLNSNGQFLAFTDGDLTVRVYNVVSGALVRTFNESFQSPIFDIDLSPNGEDIAISFAEGGGGKLRVYNVSNGSLIADKPQGEAGGDIEYSWDNFITNYFLAAGTSNGLDVRLYRPNSNYAPVCFNPPTCTNFVIAGLGNQSLAFSKEGTYLAASSGLGVKVIHTSGNPTTLTSLSPGVSRIHSIVFSPNNLNLVITGIPINGLPNPDGGNIASFPIPAVGFPWVTTPLAQWNAESLGTGRLRVAYSNTSKLAVWGQQHIKFWDTGIGQQCGPPPLPCSEFQNPFTDSYRLISAVAYSPDGTMVAAGGEGGSIGENNKISIWNAATGARIKTLDYGTNATSVKSLVFPDDLNIIAGGTDGVKLIRISDGMVPNSSAETGELVISPNRQMVAVGSTTGNSSIVVLRNTSNLAFIRNIFTGGSGSGSNAIPLAFTPDNSRIAAAEAGSATRLFDVSTGNLVFSFDNNGSTKVRGGFTPNGQYFFVGGEINQISVWNAITGTFVRSLPGYTGNITGVNITPDGQYLFTASKDARIRVWHISAPNPADWVLVRTYDEETGSANVGGSVDTATLSPDGSRYFYGRFDATVVMANNPFLAASVQFNAPTYTVNENGITATITVTRTASSSGAVSVNYATSDGTATAGQDYTSTTGTLNWADGDSTEKTFIVNITDDNIFEGDETINLALSNPTGGSVLGSPSNAVLTIVDNETQPTLSINDVFLNEGDSGTTAFNFNVTLSGQTTQTVMVNYATADGTATAPSDYTAVSTTQLTFNPGETSKQITVLVNGDTLDENHEAFFVNLSGATNATLLDNQGIGSITDDDGQPRSNGKIVFNSYRSDPGGDIWTMNADGTNQTRLTINTAVDLQAQWSPDGTMIVFRSERDGGGLSAIYKMNADGSNQTRLTNNGFDAAPAWSPDGTKIVYRSIRMDLNPDIYVMNADGTNQMRLTTSTANDAQPRWSPNGAQIVFMSERDGNQEVYVMNADGTNQTRLTNSAGDDANPDWSPDGSKIVFNSFRDGDHELYTMNADGTNQARLTNSPGDDGLASWSPDGAKIAFTTIRDGNYEIYSITSDGSNPLRLTNDAGIDGSPDWQQVVLPPSVISLSAPTYSFNETAGTATISVVRAQSSSGAVSVNYATSDGTAMAGKDYSATSGTLNWADGDSTQKTFVVNITDDNVFEGDETVNIALSNPTGGAVLGSPNIAVLTIVDNETQPTLSINDVILNEGNSGTTAFNFNAVLSGQTTQSVTVNYSTADGTATAPGDYTAVPTTQLTFNPGETIKQITVVVNGDTINETNENFFVNLSGAANAAIFDDQGYGTIMDDDGPPPNNGPLVFASLRDGNEEIYKINPDGSGEMRLTNNNAIDVNPQWSPDGSKIAFNSDRDSSNQEIFVMNADGTNPTRLTNNTFNDSQPAWSPDGTKIVYRSFQNGHQDIYVMNADGSNQTRLTTETSNESKPRWSPDGAKIAFVSNRDGGDLEIYSINTDGTGQTRLTNSTGVDTDLDWSPDSSKLVFSSSRDGNSEIYVMNASGTNQTRLTNNSVHDAVASWSPDGANIAFSRGLNNDTIFEIFIMNADGTNPGQITNFNSDSGQVDWQMLSVARNVQFDFDGDFKTDIGIFRPSLGEWWYLRSSDGTNRAFQFGQGTDKIVPADYTGDGKTDIAIWRPASGEWFVLRSEDSSFYSFPFGTSTDIPVPGDYDGDGKSDPAVFRPSTTTWFINQSTGGFRILDFGANGDQPVVADYDGDGKSDIAIYRPSNGTW